MFNTIAGLKLRRSMHVDLGSDLDNNLKNFAVNLGFSKWWNLVLIDFWVWNKEEECNHTKISQNDLCTLILGSTEIIIWRPLPSIFGLARDEILLPSIVGFDQERRVDSCTKFHEGNIAKQFYYWNCIKIVEPNPFYNNHKNYRWIYDVTKSLI